MTMHREQYPLRKSFGYGENTGVGVRIPISSIYALLPELLGSENVLRQVFIALLLQEPSAWMSWPPGQLSMLWSCAASHRKERGPERRRHSSTSCGHLELPEFPTAGQLYPLKSAQSTPGLQRQVFLSQPVWKAGFMFKLLGFRSCLPQIAWYSADERRWNKRSCALAGLQMRRLSLSRPKVARAGN